ncbi:MAG TPA: hypothetical protein VF247_01030 [Candidatus Krumholzibacteria bacterium]
MSKAVHREDAEERGVRAARRLLIVAFILLLAVPAHAQNPFTVNSSPRNRRVAEKVEAICQREAPRIAAELGLERIQPIQIDITDDVGPYNRSHGGKLPEWGIAFAVLQANRIVVDVKRATREFNSLDEVVPHELSHLLAHQRAPNVRLPIWFGEGLAQWQSREWSLVDQWELMRSVWIRSSPRLADMYLSYPAEETRAQQAYRVAYAGFVDLFREVGFDDLGPFLAEAEREQSFERGFRNYFGYSVAEYQAYFQDDFERKYGSGWMAFQAEPLLAFAALLFFAVIVRYWIKRRRKFAHLDD